MRRFTILFEVRLTIFVSITLQAIFCYWITSNLFSLIYGLGESFQIPTCQQFNFMSTFSILGCKVSSVISMLVMSNVHFNFSFRRLEVE
jgi:hypothetical protein